jgi:hypothetical protein
MPGLKTLWLRRERFRLRMREESHRLEAIIAGPASPEIGGAARSGLNPFRSGDRLAALGAGIFPGQGTEVYSCHGASPFFFSDSFMSEEELDRIVVGCWRSGVPFLDGVLGQLSGRVTATLCSSEPNSFCVVEPVFRTPPHEVRRWMKVDVD